MTKTGAPSLIDNISYCAGPPPKFNRLESGADVALFGLRVALFLRSHGVRFADWTHLFIRVTEGENASAPLQVNKGLEWWSRFADITVPIGFSRESDDTKRAVLIRRTRKVLKELRPDLAEQIDAACDAVEARGDDMRFVIKSKVTDRERVDVSVNVPTGRSAAHLFVTVTNLNDGSIREAPPLQLRYYEDAWPLAASLSRPGSEIVIKPRTSFDGRVRTEKYVTPIVISEAMLQTVTNAAPLVGSGVPSQAIGVG